MPASAAVYGCQGTELAPDERAFFRDVHPAGFILFARNCVTPEQVGALCDALRDAAEANVPILIDQEGGRVARLKPPHWRARPPARRFGDLYAIDPEAGCDAAYLCARLIAHELRLLGVDVNCAPILDVPVPGAHDIIGDRAYSLDPSVVVALGRATMEGYLDGGVLPVIKHIPGHGRALADSHLSLPRVTTSVEDLATHDFAPFCALRDAPIAMTAHVVYEAIDAERPATTSPRVVQDIIRDAIGFDGLLMSDDLSMAALEGPFAARAAAALAAGCDIALHCNGRLDEMKEVASGSHALTGKSLTRAEDALARRYIPTPLDVEAAEKRLASMMGPLA